MQDYIDPDGCIPQQCCLQCGVVPATDDWCIGCIQQFEAWLQRDYCEVCCAVMVPKGQIYCDNCADALCIAMALVYDAVLMSEGLY